MPFKTADIPDLKGKVAIVTGANTGIGKVSALEMAKWEFFNRSVSQNPPRPPNSASFCSNNRHGAHVILACRSAEKTTPVVEEIKKQTGNELVEFMELDLSSLHSIRDFANNFKAKNVHLHILLNNAGVMGCPYSLTKDGIEMQFGTNHIGHFYLTMLLFDVIEKSEPARIVNVSSVAHRSMAPSAGVLFDSINDQAVYRPNTMYGQSKLCNVLFTRELARRIGTEKPLYTNVLHPGVIDTDLYRNFNHMFPSFLATPFLAIGRLFMLSPESGALTQLYLSTSPDVEKDNIRAQYYIPIAKKSVAQPLGQNDELARKLWDFSVALIKEKVPDFEMPESLKENERA